MTESHATDMMRVRVRLERCELKPLGQGRYEAVVQGYNLHGSIVPPRVMVGGIELEQLRFQPDGLVLRGVLPEQPHDRSVVVDYGFARAALDDAR